MTNIVIRAYSLLLWLYPTAFRREFREQMLLDFSDLAVEASKKGSLSLLFFFVRELIDFPASLLQIHWRDGIVFKVLRSQPVNTGLRTALGFGVVFATANIISMFVALKLAVPADSLVEKLQALYMDHYRAEYPLGLITWIPSSLGSILIGLMLGGLFAALFADRSNYFRYLLAGLLGWSLKDAATSFLLFSFNFVVFLDDHQGLYFKIMTNALAGAILGLTFVVAKSERRQSFREFVVLVISYPIVSFLYVKLLFNIFVLNTPWRFVGLMTMLLTFISGVFMIAINSNRRREVPWVVVTGAVGYPILYYVLGYAMRFMYPPMPSWGLILDEFIFWPQESLTAISNALFGLVFGMLIGMLFELEKKNQDRKLAISG